MYFFVPIMLFLWFSHSTSTVVFLFPLPVVCHIYCLLCFHGMNSWIFIEAWALPLIVQWDVGIPFMYQDIVWDIPSHAILSHPTVHWDGMDTREWCIVGRLLGILNREVKINVHSKRWMSSDIIYYIRVLRRTQEKGWKHAWSATLLGRSGAGKVCLLAWKAFASATVFINSHRKPGITEKKFGAQTVLDVTEWNTRKPIILCDNSV